MSYHYEKLDYLIAIAASACLEEEEARLNAMDTSGVSFDAGYYRKRARMIRQAKRRPALQTLKRVAVRLAVATLALILFAALVIGCVPTVREALFKAVIEWHDEYFKVSFQPNGGKENTTDTDVGTGTEAPDETEPKTPENTEEETTPITTPIPPVEIEVKRKPTSLPKGVYEDILKDSISGLTIDYYLNDEFILSYSQNLMDTQGKYDDTEVTITEITVNGNTGILVEYRTEPIKIVEWTDGEYRYQLYSVFYGKEDLIAIAESVK